MFAGSSSAEQPDLGKPSPTVHALPLLFSFSGQYNFERESLAFAFKCPQAFTIHSKEESIHEEAEAKTASSRFQYRDRRRRGCSQRWWADRAPSWQHLLLDIL